MFLIVRVKNRMNSNPDDYVAVSKARLIVALRRIAENIRRYRDYGKLPPI
jgi:hypothetical protein